PGELVEGGSAALQRLRDLRAGEREDGDADAVEGLGRRPRAGGAPGRGHKHRDREESKQSEALLHWTSQFLGARGQAVWASICPLTLVGLDLLLTSAFARKIGCLTMTGGLFGGNRPFFGRMDRMYAGRTGLCHQRCDREDQGDDPLRRAPARGEAPARERARR